MPLLHFWAPCAGSVSPLATLLLPHTTMQWDMGMSNGFSIHIPCPFPLPQALFPPPHALLTTFAILWAEQAQPVPAVCCGARLSGNDSYRQDAGTGEGALPCSSLCKGLCESSKCLKYNLPPPKGADKGSHKVQTTSQTALKKYRHAGEQVRLCSPTALIAEGKRRPDERRIQQLCPTDPQPPPTPRTGTQLLPMPRTIQLQSGSKFPFALLSAGTVSPRHTWGRDAYRKW